MKQEDAEMLAAHLLKLLRSGEDQQAQIQFISNYLRMKKPDASELHKQFISGVNAGCDSVMNNTGELVAGNDPHPLYTASFRLGRGDFEERIEEQRRKSEKKGCAAALVFLVLMVVGLIALCAFY